MEVQGVSPERVDEVEGNTVVDGTIDAAGNLKLITGDGAQKNAGKVIVPLAAWPVGSIYMGTSSTNPVDLFGGGTWERFGKGRVLVGVDENDASFNGPNVSGGAKTHTLTASEMPSHAHGGTTYPAGDHTHAHDAVREIGGGVNAYGPGSSPLTAGGNTGPSGNHSHAIAAEGGGQPHNNLQPYISVYMWRRTA